VESPGPPTANTRFQPRARAPPRRLAAPAPSSASSAAISASPPGEVTGTAVTGGGGGGGAGGSHSLTNVHTIAVSLAATVSADPTSGLALPVHEKLFR
jgi:hypothetical protein